MDLALLLTGLFTLTFALPAALGSRVPRLVAPFMAILAILALLPLPIFLAFNLIGLALGLTFDAAGRGLGLAGLVAHGSSALCLVVLAWRHHWPRLTRDGARWSPTWVGPRPLKMWWYNLIRSSPDAHRVTCTRVSAWRQAEGVSLSGYIWREAGVTEPRPGIIFLHGGAWLIGGPKQSWHYCEQLAAAGYVVFGPRYRLAPRFTLPQSLADAKAAVAWLREHALEHGVDPDRLVVMGASAGGHMANMVAVTGSDKSFQPGFETADASVSAAVVFYGVADLVFPVHTRPHAVGIYLLERLVVQRTYKDEPELFHRLSAITHARADQPPTLLIHGNGDGLVSVKDARRYVKRLAEVGAAHSFIEIDGALHAFTVQPNPTAWAALLATREFLSENL